MEKYDCSEVVNFTKEDFKEFLKEPHYLSSRVQEFVKDCKTIFQSLGNLYTEEKLALCLAGVEVELKVISKFQGGDLFYGTLGMDLSNEKESIN